MFGNYVKKFMNFANNISLQLKILGITVGFIVLFGAGVTLEMRNIVYNTMLGELDKQGESIVSNLAARSADLVLTNNIFELHLLLQHTVENNDSVKYAFILNDSNEVVAHSFLKGFPVELKNVHVTDGAHHINKVILNINERVVHDFMSPIIDGKVGTARLGFDESAIQESIKVVTNTILQTTFVMALVGILAAFILAHIISSPLTYLVEVMKNFSFGDYSQRVEVTSDDEVGKLGKAFNEMGDALEVKEVENKTLLLELEKKEQVRRNLLKKVIGAQELERKRISRELHDETGQLLSSQMLYLRHIKDTANTEHFEASVENMRRLIARTIKEVKRMSQQLRPSVLDDMGLISAIERLVMDYREVLEVDIDLVVHGEMTNQRLATEIEIAIYRILQEALTNIYKYAKAENVSIILNFRPQSLQIIIEDDGIGFNYDELVNSRTNEDRLGIHGMRERTELVNGSYDIESQEDMGTTIYVTVPVVYES